MVSNYSIDGLRIDTAINVQPEFFIDFVNASGVFATGETKQGDNLLVCRWAETIGSILNYPIYYPLTRAFSSWEGSINDLVTTIYTMQENCADPTAFGLFSENHDVERFAQITNDTSLAKNVVTFTIMGDGIPIIYQGQEQHMAGGISPYTNRAPLWTTGYNTDAFLYKHIATLVSARQQIVKTSEQYTAFATEVIYQDYHSFAMRKGNKGQQVITVLNNNGAFTEDFELHLSGHGLSSGVQVTEILTCTNVTVDASGILTVSMGSGLPKVFYPTRLLADSGICGVEQPKSDTGSSNPSVATTSAGGSGTTTDTTASPGHTRLALGSASHVGLDALTVTMMMIAGISVIFASSGICLAMR